MQAADEQGGEEVTQPTGTGYLYCIVPVWTPCNRSYGLLRVIIEKYFHKWVRYVKKEGKYTCDQDNYYKVYCDDCGNVVSMRLFLLSLSSQVNVLTFPSIFLAVDIG